jgi:hypothetical protein
MKELNRMVIIALAGVSLLGWGVVLYQQRLADESQVRVRDAVLKELEERLDIQDSVKDEMAKKERDKAFVMQLEYQRGIEDQVSGKLADYENKYAALEQELSQDLERKTAEFDKKQLDYAQRLEIYAAQLKEYEKARQELKERAAADRRELLQRLEALRSSLSRQDRDSGKRDTERIKQLEDLKDQVAALRSRVGELSAQISRLKEKPAPAPAE